jgi:alpha-tubulin suppressor-like RCC1 family protein
VFACGLNDFGQLGLGDYDNRYTFTAVPLLPDDKVAKQVIAGSNHTIIITKDNTVFGCGRCYQLNLINTQQFKEINLNLND